MLKKSGIVATLLMSESKALKTKQAQRLLVDPTNHSDSDVTLYANMMAEGKKFVENDPQVVQIREQA
jgi:hypothetical protein